MTNYSNYFTAIEDRFQQRRGTILCLSTLDWAIIETWREAGIPLQAVLNGIDEAFDKYEERQKRARMRRIKGLNWCAQAVMDAAQNLLEASVGTAKAGQAAQDSGFEQERLASHLESSAARLAAVAIAPQAAAETGKRLKNLAAEVKSTPEPDIEGLERTLTVLEEKLYAAMLAEVPEQLLAVFSQQAALELASCRQRVSAQHLRLIEKQYVQKLMLAHYQVPRLSLFYMSQS